VESLEKLPQPRLTKRSIPLSHKGNLMKRNLIFSITSWIIS